MGLFIFSVCHVVLIVQDELTTDLKILRYIQTIRMLQKGIPNILMNNEPNQIIEEYVPDIVFVFNKLKKNQMVPMYAYNIRNTLDLFFKNVEFRKNGNNHIEKINKKNRICLSSLFKEARKSCKFLHVTI